MADTALSPLRMLLMQALFGIGLTLVLGSVAGGRPSHTHHPTRQSLLLPPTRRPVNLPCAARRGDPGRVRAYGGSAWAQAGVDAPWVRAVPHAGCAQPHPHPHLHGTHPHGTHPSADRTVVQRAVGFTARFYFPPAGTVAVLSLVEEFGAAAAVLVTLVRKCSSMLLSYALWPKPLSGLHVGCAGGVHLRSRASLQLSGNRQRHADRKKISVIDLPTLRTCNATLRFAKLRCGGVLFVPAPHCAADL